MSTGYGIIYYQMGLTLAFDVWTLTDYPASRITFVQSYLIANTFASALTSIKEKALSTFAVFSSPRLVLAPATA